jgi:hypothetical protein
VVSGIALASVVAVPSDAGGSIPPSSTFAAAGIIVALVMPPAIAAAGFAQRLPMRAVIALAAGFACIALVKFFFGPDLVAVMVLGLAYRDRAGARRGAPRLGHVIVAAIVAFLALAGSALLVSGNRYLDILFDSDTAVIPVALLIAAVVLVAAAFHSAANEAQRTAQAGIYVSIFWVAIAALVLFHVLWIVYLLALIAVWPLRTVTPK